MSRNDYSTVNLTRKHRKVILEKLNRARSRNFALLVYLEDKAHIREIGLWLDEVEEAVRATDAKIADLFALVNNCGIVGNDGYCWLE